jgi:type IV secretion system protein VirB11
MLQGERTLRYLLSPLEPILTTPGVTEIVFNRPGEFGVERRGAWEWHTDAAFEFDRLDAIGILAGQLMAKRFDPEHPLCLTSLPDGERFTAVRPPVMAQGNISATIRVPSRTQRRVDDDDFDALIEGVNDSDARQAIRDRRLIELYRAGQWKDFFKLAVESRRTILATGATGSGKTTLLKRLMNAIPQHERLVTIEDTDEFGVLPQRNRVAMFYGSAGTTAENLVEVSLRMKPDRVAMQELRGTEAFGYLRVLLAGHPGSVSTLHADRGADAAFEALLVMVKQHSAGREIPDDKLRGLIRRLIDIVVWCTRDERGFQIPYVYFRDAEDEVAAA